MMLAALAYLEKNSLLVVSEHFSNLQFDLEKNGYLVGVARSLLNFVVMVYVEDVEKKVNVENAAQREGEEVVVHNTEVAGFEVNSDNEVKADIAKLHFEVMVNIEADVEVNVEVEVAVCIEVEVNVETDVDIEAGVEVVAERLYFEVMVDNEMDIANEVSVAKRLHFEVMVDNEVKKSYFEAMVDNEVGEELDLAEEAVGLA
ncbi:2606_t:CDS:2, partial [Acaulospora colombiana]